MKIVYIAHRIPYPPNKGDKIRAFHEVQALAELGDVYLFALVDDLVDWKYQSKLLEICKEVHLVLLKPKTKRLLSLRGLLSRKPMSVLYFYQQALQDKLDIVFETQSVDVVFCYSGTSAEYIYGSKFRENLLLDKPDTPRLVMDFCDVDSLKWKEYSERMTFPMSLLYSQEAILMKRYEKRIAKDFDQLLIITEEEKKLFQQHVDSEAELSVVGNGVDLDYFSPDNDSVVDISNREGVEILFVGAMDYQANVDGVCWFVDEIWPSVLRKFESACFTIVGRNPVHEIIKLHGSRNIFVTGTVEDVRPYYKRATLVVVPLRIARGIQNKVLEAMSMGKAVVASENSATGIEVVFGKDLLVVEEDGDVFSDTVCLLLEDKRRCEAIGRAARQSVLTGYSWASCMSRVKLLLT